MNGGTGEQEGHQGHRRLDMANNSPFNLSSLVNNPSYDFLSFLTNSEENADSPDSFTTHSESPYSQSNFLTHYTDITSLSSTLNTNTQLSILSLNIQSLPSKYNDLLELISSLSSHHCQPDLICLQEIWSVMDSDHFPLPGYQPLTFKTRTTCQGGGVGIYVRTGLPFKICKSKSIFTDKLYESLFITITLPSSKTLTIGTLYRPNSKYSTLSATEQFNQFNEILLNTLSSIDITHQTIIVGDTNLDALKYGTNGQVTSYIDSLFTSGFLQTITKPTRCTNHSATLIDHVITNISQPTYTNHILTHHISDHFPILTLTNEHSKKTPKTTHTFSDFSNANITRFKDNLSTLHWTDTLNSQCPESAFNSFHSTFTTLHNFYFQPKTVNFNINHHKHEKWMTQGLLTSRLTKLKLASTLSKSPTPLNTTIYKNYRNIYNTTLRACKKLHFTLALAKNSNNLKKTWSILNTALNKHKTHTPIHSLFINNTLITDPLTIANSFNTYFTTIADITASHIHPTTDPLPPNHSSPKPPLLTFTPHLSLTLKSFPA